MLELLAGLIRLPALRQPVMEGLAISIGGLDAQLAAAAGAALIQVIASPTDPAPSLDGTQLHSPLLLDVTDCVLTVWGRQPRCALLHSRVDAACKFPALVTWCTPQQHA